MVQAFSLDNYARLLTVPLYRRVLLRTLEIALTTSAISVLLAYPLALVMARGNRAWSRLLMLVVISPLLVLVVVRAYGWKLILAKQGLLNWLLVWRGRKRRLPPLPPGRQLPPRAWSNSITTRPCSAPPSNPPNPAPMRRTTPSAKPFSASCPAAS
jgi:ABC-type sugar transport system permease subunit